MSDQLPEFKRVVTGHNAEGLAIISSAAPTPNVFPLKAMPDTIFHEIWSTTGTPVKIDNGADPFALPLKLSPPPLGSRIRVVDIPPDSVQDQISSEGVSALFSEIGSRHATTAHADSKHKIMHRTETVDYGIVIEGEVWLVVDDGEVHCKHGDIIIQRGTNHAWSNRTEKMARVIFILLDGRYAEELNNVRGTQP